MKTFSTIVLVVIFILVLIYFIFGNSYSFTADIDGSAFKADRGGASYRSGRLVISVGNAGPDSTQVMLYVNATKVGTYLFNDDNLQTGNIALYSIGNGKIIFTSTSSFTGSVTILDLDKKKVSGTFVFRAVQVQPYGSRVVNVTNGAFEDVPINAH